MFYRGEMVRLGRWPVYVEGGTRKGGVPPATFTDPCVNTNQKNTYTYMNQHEMT